MSSPAATEDAIRLLDGRQSGVELAEKFGDILDTREGTDGSQWEGRAKWSGLRGSKPINACFLNGDGARRLVTSA